MAGPGNRGAPERARRHGVRVWSPRTTRSPTKDFMRAPKSIGLLLQFMLSANCLQHLVSRKALSLRSQGMRTSLLCLAANDGEQTDWEDAMRKLRARQRESADAQAEAEPAKPVEQVEPLEPVELDATGGMAPAGREPRTSAGFRFEQLDNIPTQSQGAMDNEPLVRFAILYGGRALTAITLCSLVFYVYVGLSGGITDGFDRYQEPIEDIRVTMQREGMDGFSPL